MQVHIAIYTFFICLLLSSSYAEAMRTTAKLGQRREFRYQDSDILYIIYTTPFGTACYLRDEIIIDCAEL